ncbi:hypothetical protein J690_1722 [Acinetobacter sp. 742879]|uniref:hypothetical protein n=1 Tax=Acinetobacter calcoaceticus/baumannii complex TaxID=909768 RepID=UPI0004528547|nr:MULTISPECIES: hypothetical protein [Acinetobacter calcoaceticus/baumannii complex]EXS28824.1 hypothetical protein J690_1722 [Acinetobacter sp. 742879]KRI62582.1 hypothetical protein APC62_05945 [Acinetobacter pittii]MBN6539877.1 hypothetical protein [Acinetobacter pittii]OCY30950.1 hypothetical protein BFR75_10535 [Acinetobacter pittii]OTU42633.1 hypothetical protein CAT37_14465 [Acinetobacter pittii]
MKLKAILLFTIVLAGCQQQPKDEQYRHTVCQSLIEGYLKMTNQQDYKMEQRTDEKTSTISHYQYKRNSSNEVVMVNSVYSTLYFSCREQQKSYFLSQHSSQGQTTPLLEVHFPTDSYTTFRERF